MKNFLTLLLIAALAAGGSGVAHAFCGFYVAKADARLFNRASQVVPKASRAHELSGLSRFEALIQKGKAVL